MLMQCCDIFEVFDEKSNLLKEYSNWKLLVRNRNTTLGNCVAITKRHMERFSDITTSELAEFAQVVKDSESAIKKSFGYDKINYQMLMMKDKHVHFHIIPRYASKRDFAGMQWTDEGWPNLPPANKENLSATMLQKIKEEIIKNM